MATYKEPESVQEYLRLAHAFLAGSRFPPGRTVFVVAANVAPLRRVQGIYATADEAETVADGPVDLRLGWSQAERDNRVIYQMVVPDLGYTNDVVMIEHPSWTEWSRCDLLDGARPRFDQITEMELRITSGTRTTRYAVSRDADAIFITRGAVELFLSPHHTAVFGRTYAEAARESMLTPPRPTH